jgi:hypothetical protein
MMMPSNFVSAIRRVDSRSLGPVVLLVMLALCGCAGGPARVTLSPMSYDQQQAEVLKVVPLQTPRAEVEKKLKDAGIDVEPGAGASIAYCGVWKRPDGARWKLDVALLFDEKTRLYAVRPATSDTAVLKNTVARQAKQIDKNSKSSGWGPARSASGSSPATSPSSPPRDDTASADAGSGRGSGARLPFGAK